MVSGINCRMNGKGHVDDSDVLRCHVSVVGMVTQLMTWADLQYAHNSATDLHGCDCVQLQQTCQLACMETVL